MPTPLKNKHTRKPRVLLRVRVEFEGGLPDDPIQGEGQSTDINVSGCSVESDQRVSIGTHLALRIHLSGHAVPVTVTVARVRWVHGSEFGIEFIQTQHQDQLRLSQIPKETQEVEALSIPETPMSPQESPYTILVVDDDLEILKLCTLTLKRYGFNVLQAAGSKEAMEICSAHVGDIHLALVDVMLDPPAFQLRTEKQPYLRVHGHTLFNGLRETRKGLRAVMMSAHSKATLKKDGIVIGDIPFLQKPLFVETLIATIRQQVEGLRLEDAS